MTTEDDSRSVVARFMRNWVDVLWGFITEISYPIGLFVGCIIVTFCVVVYAVVPMVVYTVYVYGMETLFTEEILLSSTELGIIIILEMVWVALSASAVAAALKTYRGE